MPEKEEEQDNNEAHKEPTKDEPERDRYSELKEQTLRLAAEFDNYKKRAKKDFENAERIGKMSIIKTLLPVVDEFELAILALNERGSNLSKGLEMVYHNFMAVLKREGLKEIEVGERFDPYKHEIVMVKESGDKEGNIIEVVKKGYMFDNQLLRPAAVIIAKSKTKENEKNNNEQN